MALKPETVIGLTDEQKAALQAAFFRVGKPSSKAVPVPIQTDLPSKSVEEPARDVYEVLSISY